MDFLLDPIDSLNSEIDADNDEEIPMLKELLEKKSRAHYVRPGYWNSCWGRMLKLGDFSNIDSRESKRFRRRFRVPYTLYRSILHHVKDWFPQPEFDACGQATSKRIIKKEYLKQ